jgi:hypothetical protein
MNAHARPTKFPEANGLITLPLGVWAFHQKVTLHGGPYDGYTEAFGTYGVCVRAEQTKGKAIDTWLPIHDFNVPEHAEDVQEALLETFEAALNGKDVYVGCMGGWGRTGLFLALCAKVAGVPDPVGFVRQNYTERAVETKTQKAYVDAFDVSQVRATVLSHARKRWIKDVVFWWI